MLIWCKRCSIPSIRMEYTIFYAIFVCLFLFLIVRDGSFKFIILFCLRLSSIFRLVSSTMGENCTDWANLTNYISTLQQNYFYYLHSTFCFQKVVSKCHTILCVLQAKGTMILRTSVWKYSNKDLKIGNQGLYTLILMGFSIFANNGVCYSAIYNIKTLLFQRTNY